MPQKQIFFREQLMQLLMIAFTVALLFLFFFLNSYLNEIINRFPPLMDCTLIEDEFTSKEEFNAFGILDKDSTLDGYGQGQY